MRKGRKSFLCNVVFNCLICILFKIVDNFPSRGVGIRDSFSMLLVIIINAYIVTVEENA